LGGEKDVEGANLGEEEVSREAGEAISAAVGGGAKAVTFKGNGGEDWGSRRWLVHSPAFGILRIVPIYVKA
jgi:hypothetical protein